MESADGGEGGGGRGAGGAGWTAATRACGRGEGQGRRQHQAIGLPLVLRRHSAREAGRRGQADRLPVDRAADAGRVSNGEGRRAHLRDAQRRVHDSATASTARRITTGWKRRCASTSSSRPTNGLPNVICFSGNRRGMSDDEGLANCADRLEAGRRLRGGEEGHDLHGAAQQQGRITRTTCATARRGAWSW